MHRPLSLLRVACLAAWLLPAVRGWHVASCAPSRRADWWSVPPGTHPHVPPSFLPSTHLQAEPFVVEALFPLFELLHHYWINQADRDSTLQELGRLLAPAVFGTPAEHGLPAEDAGLLSDTGAPAGCCACVGAVLWLGSRARVGCPAHPPPTMLTWSPPHTCPALQWRC